MVAKKAAAGSSKSASAPRKRTAAVSKASAKVATLKPRSKPKLKGKGKGASKKAVVALAAVTRDEIALRAFQIWQAKGKPAGQDSINWKQAEAQLISERRR